MLLGGEGKRRWRIVRRELRFGSWRNSVERREASGGLIGMGLQVLKLIMKARMELEHFEMEKKKK